MRTVPPAAVLLILTGAIVLLRTGSAWVQRHIHHSDD